MKPVKGLLPFATWLMRLALAVFVFVTFIGTLKGFEYKTIQFYVALVYIVFGTLLFLGGFMNKPGITVFSGLMLFLVSVYRIIMLFSGGVDANLAIYFIIASVSLYYFTAGNKN
ncbi:MAG TPA: hypothetical protein PKK00_09630 [Bacteroidales bacterium]|nr:hypothetical protein [Bacteroidales bacterium]HPS15882.1 hypothetical protein [Bacteroidales bacterium]